MPDQYFSPDLDKAAQRGEPSAVWREGQERRLKMIRQFGAESMEGRVLVNGTGIGAYQSRLAQKTSIIIGLDIEFPRLLAAKAQNQHLVCAAGEYLPFAKEYFTAVLSNEVLEHVDDDSRVVEEASRVLAKRGRLLLFCPNRGYPFETHGIYRTQRAGRPVGGGRGAASEVSRSLHRSVPGHEPDPRQGGPGADGTDRGELPVAALSYERGVEGSVGRNVTRRRPDLGPGYGASHSSRGEHHGDKNSHSWCRRPHGRPPGARSARSS